MTPHQEKIDQYLDSGLGPEDAAQFEQWLKEDQNLQLLAARAELHTDLRRSLQRRSVQKEAMSHFPDLTSHLGETEPDTQRQEQTFSRRPNTVASTTNTNWYSKKWSILAMTTAAILLFAFLSIPESESPNRQTAARSQRIARIAYQQNAGWQSGPRVTGDAVGGGMVQLQVGIARLDFSNGATVTLQGPAKFEISFC